MKIKITFITFFAICFLGVINYSYIPFDRMILIPGAEFLMGDSTKINNQSSDIDNDIGHYVKVDSFYIDKYEVTNAEFRLFVEKGGYFRQELWSEEGWRFIRSNNINGPGFWDDPDLGFSHPDKPVVGVTFYEAEAYAKWIGKRLPTEAEWELAARGTDGRPYPWGTKSPDYTLANFLGFSKSTSKVGSFPKGNSPYGISDMAGNVMEWVNDAYESGYYTYGPKENPKGPPPSVLCFRVVRGGSFMHSEENLLTYKRFRFRQNFWDKFLGFRCARSK